ncbi:hypothetical protein MTO96_030536 [Rhipicephalus appendiculatus]
METAFYGLSQVALFVGYWWCKCRANLEQGLPLLPTYGGLDHNSTASWPTVSSCLSRYGIAFVWTGFILGGCVAKGFVINAAVHVIPLQPVAGPQEVQPTVTPRWMWVILAWFGVAADFFIASLPFIDSDYLPAVHAGVVLMAAGLAIGGICGLLWLVDKIFGPNLPMSWKVIKYMGYGQIAVFAIMTLPAGLRELLKFISGFPMATAVCHDTFSRLELVNVAYVDCFYIVVALRITQCRGGQHEEGGSKSRCIIPAKSREQVASDEGNTLKTRMDTIGC